MAQIVEVKVPDIGDFKDVPIIELLVKVGDAVKAEDSLMTLESDKATMDIPCPVSGVVTELKVKVGDKVAEGVLLALVQTGAEAAATAPAPPNAAAPATPAATVQAAAPVPPVAAVAGPGADYRPGDPELIVSQPRVTMPTPAERLTGSAAHASPSVRRFARELGVDVGKVTGTGPKGRITQADVQAWVKGFIGGAATPAAAPRRHRHGARPAALAQDRLRQVRRHRGAAAVAHQEDFRRQPLAQLGHDPGRHLSRGRRHHRPGRLPRADQQGEREVRRQVRRQADHARLPDQGLRQGDAEVPGVQRLARRRQMSLVLKKYFHIGFAADTPNGLMVPVIKNADSKGVFELARESGELAKQAREGKLKPADMQGACFTISSVGGIGGTGFAPIVNAPEVAILGVSKSVMKPVWDGKAFQPRLILPLSLTADHRVIDGALATRFNVYLAQLMADMRRSML
jgi:pyruvate dehydrogenase E2 component (dihydrolipoamide acetyltransferase)